MSYDVFCQYVNYKDVNIHLLKVTQNSKFTSDLHKINHQSKTV